MMSQKLKNDEPEVENVSVGRKMEVQLLRMIVASCVRGILVMELVGGSRGAAGGLTGIWTRLGTDFGRFWPKTGQNGPFLGIFSLFW